MRSTSPAESTPAKFIPPILDALWLILLSAYLLSGLSLIPLHGDEASYVWLSSDWTYLVLKPDVQRLYFQPHPSNPADEHLHLYRVATGAVARYAYGITWWLNGYHPDDVPANDWNWDISGPANEAAGNLPPPGMMLVTRRTASLFLVVGIGALFFMARLFGGRALAYTSTALFSLHPLVLLEGRRAMSEGPMAGMSLLALGTACVAVTHLKPDTPLKVRLGWLTLLGVLIGLVFGCKQTGLAVGIAIGLSFGLLALIEERQKGLPRALWSAGWPVAWMAGVALALFYIISPPYWPDPVGASVATWEYRWSVGGAQAYTWGGYDTPGERILVLAEEMFIPAPTYADVADWTPYLAPSIHAYQNSPFHGLPLWRPIIAYPLGALAGVGAAVLLVAVATAEPARRKIALLILAWVAVNMIVTLLVIEHRWQRYYFPVVPPAIVLQSIGIAWVISTLRNLVQGRISRRNDQRLALQVAGLGVVIVAAAVITTTAIAHNIDKPTRLLWFDPSDAPQGTPINLTYANDIRLVSMSFQPRQPRSGDIVHLTLNWTLAGTPVDHEYTTLVHLIDTNGNAILNADSSFAVPNQTSSWVPGVVIEERIPVRIPPGTAPGAYGMQIGVLDDRTSTSPPASDSGGAPLDAFPTLASINVQRPLQAPPTASLGISAPLDLPVTGGASLQDVKLTPTSNQVGQPFYLSWVWSMKGSAWPASGSYSTRLVWLDSQGKEAASTKPFDPVPGYPVSQWRSGDLWRGTHVLHVPGSLAAGEYQIAAVMQNGNQAEGEPAVVGKMIVGTPDRTFDPPNLQHPVEASWANQITLLGYDVQSESSPITLTLYWQPQQELDQHLVRFVHLIDADGNLVAQNDSVPNNGARPTLGWAPGEVIAEPITLDVPPGKYTIHVGWYDPETGVRVNLSDGSDLLSLSDPLVVNR